MTVEFSRPQRLDQIGAGESRVAIHADVEERRALAKRFGLATLDSLDADFTLRKDAIGVVAKGHLSAALIQSCIVTDEPVPGKIEEDFAIRFISEPGENEASDEHELSEDECDTVFYSGSAIDLGEAAAETLALALDPYPRSPNAAATLRAAGVISEEEAGPFGALAGLKDKLAGK